VHFRIVPEAEGSRVTWAMDGTNNFMAKVMTLFMSMDSALGKDFESGLANLKRETESAPAAVTADSAPVDSSVTAMP